jgi:hypothetical protein
MDGTPRALDARGLEGQRAVSGARAAGLGRLRLEELHGRLQAKNLQPGELSKSAPSLLLTLPVSLLYYPSLPPALPPSSLRTQPLPIREAGARARLKLNASTFERGQVRVPQRCVGPREGERGVARGARGLCRFCRPQGARPGPPPPPAGGRGRAPRRKFSLINALFPVVFVRCFLFPYILVKYILKPYRSSHSDSWLEPHAPPWVSTTHNS